MKKRFFLALSLFAMATGRLQAQDEPFHGGNGDGNASAVFIRYEHSNSPMFYAYFGGNGDGFTGSEHINHIMANPPMSYAYFGGNGDGFANNEVINYTMANPPMFYAYFGGNGDGFTNNEVMPYTMANPPMFYAYFGGNGDGYAGDLLPLYIPSTLPVQLISFEGKVAGTSSLLEWKVAMEQDIRSYDLQRSGNGKSYGTIHSEGVKQLGSGAAEKRYTYTDVTPLEGANYYRLQIRDHEDAVTYSQVVLLYFKQDNQSLSLYPNPAANNLMVQYQLNNASKLRIMDMKGTVLREEALQQGTSTISIPLEQLAAGMYLLHVHSEGGLDKSIRFVKQ